MNTPNNLEWLTKAMADFVHKINNNPETSNYIGLSEDTAAFKALEQTIATKLEDQYRKGYNDNARDCYCWQDIPNNLTPHRHLLDDGKSHDIRPDIHDLTKQEEQ